MSDATSTIPMSTPTERRTGRIAPAVLLPSILALVLLLVGCGPIEVRSVPPGTDLDGVALDGDELVLRLLLDNRNDIPIRLTGARLDLTLGDIEVEPAEWPLDLVIGPRNREAIELRLPASGAVQGTLAELEGGERRSLAYTLSGALRIVDQRDAKVDRNGYLHPVPGRPGRYR